VSRTIRVLHLLFADDVLIMTTDSLQEWKEISEILKIFCSATGLSINWEKSSFHFANLQQQSLEQLKGIFPILSPISLPGLNYLGYFLKADSYKLADWNWLLAKIEKNIGHWCTRWISLGGWYTLIKSVLEGQPVYWMALAAIPATVLTKLANYFLTFCGQGCSDHSRQHLCTWQDLAKPKQKGGWGFQNIYLFNQALATSSLWHALTLPGIWNSIIKDKYLSHHSINNWLHMDTATSRSTSFIWKKLLKSKHLLTRWLCWLPGSATPSLLAEIVLWAWMSPTTSHIKCWINYTLKISIFSIKQRTAPDSETLPDRWRTSESLELSAEHSTIWNTLCATLTLSGIHLTDMEDRLLWYGGDHSSLLTVQNLYTTSSNSRWHTNITGWRKHIWKWHIPPKIKFFTWILTAHKLNTWDLLQRKGWIGPNICHLCHKDSEST
jgi:hypothetical protein